MTATDADQGLNSRVRYVLVPPSGGGDTGPFSLDATSGILRTSKPLDRETIAKYELVVQAVDRGTPELTGVASVTVVVEDVNDSPPQFDGIVDGRVRLFIAENSPVGAKVTIGLTHKGKVDLFEGRWMRSIRRHKMVFYCVRMDTNKDQSDAAAVGIAGQ